MNEAFIRTKDLPEWINNITRKEVRTIMDEIYIKTEKLPEWVVDRFFKGKDIISIDELYWEFENLICDFDELEEKYNDFRQNVEENYKYSPQA